MLWHALAEDLGTGGLRSAVRRLAQGQSLGTAFTIATGCSFVAWYAARLADISTAGVSEQASAAAEGFDAARAMAIVREMSSVRYAGREPGNLGAEEAGE